MNFAYIIPIPTKWEYYVSTYLCIKINNVYYNYFQFYL